MKFDAFHILLMLLAAISLFFNFRSTKTKKEEKQEKEEEHLPEKKGFGILVLPDEVRRKNEDVEDIEGFSKELRKEVEKLIAQKSFQNEMGDCLFVVYMDKKTGKLTWKKGKSPIDGKFTYHQHDFFELIMDLEKSCKGGMYFVHAFGHKEIYIKYNPLVVLKGKCEETVIQVSEKQTKKEEEKENSKKEQETDGSSPVVTAATTPLLTLHGGKTKRNDIRINLQDPILRVFPLTGERGKGKELEFKMGNSGNKKHFLFDSGAFDYQVAVGVGEAYALASYIGFVIRPSFYYNGEIEHGPADKRKTIRQRVQFVDHNQDALNYYILGNSSFLMDNHFFYDASSQEWNFYEKGEAGNISFVKSPEKPVFTKE